MVKKAKRKPVAARREGGARRWFVRERPAGWRTTWRLRGLILVGLVVGFWAVHRPVLTALGTSLVHQGPVRVCQAITLEHYDPDYLVFEKARDLRREGYALRVVVPCGTFGGPTHMNVVNQGIIQVMAEVSRIGDVELVPVEDREPFTLTTARAVGDHLRDEGINSVIVVSPLFRSRRSVLVYQAVLEPMGIEVCGAPSRSTRQPDDWWQTTHGVQGVLLEFGKLWYYRLWVLPRYDGVP